MTISHFFAQEFRCSILASLGSPSRTEIPASALLPHTRQNRISLDLRHLASLNFRYTTKMYILIKVFDTLTPFLSIYNIYRHVCNEISGILFSHFQFYKPRTLCKLYTG